MSEHTPGPWTYDDGEIVASGDAVIARVYTADDFPCADPERVEEWDRAAVEFEGNAALIAAAPDMLAALEMTLAWFDTAPPDSFHDAPVIEPLYDAISKAVTKARVHHE